MNVNNGVDITSIPDWLNEVHHHKIWKSADGKWCTYVDIPTKRKFIKRVKLSSLYDTLEELYGRKNKYFTNEEYEDIKEYVNDFDRYKEINVFGVKPLKYLISPFGDVYSIERKIWMSTKISHKSLNYKGQKYVTLRTADDRSQPFSVARLVCATFVGLPPEDMEDPTVDHIDGDSLNNYYKNLRWLERKDNASIRLKRNFGETNPNAILTKSDVIHICNMFVRGETDFAAIAEQYGVKKSTITSIYNRSSWNHISMFFEFGEAS